MRTLLIRLRRATYAALGAAAAYFGARALLRWSEEQALEAERRERVLRRMAQPAGAQGRQPVDQPDRQPADAEQPAAAGQPPGALAPAQDHPTEDEETLRTAFAVLAETLLAFQTRIAQLRGQPESPAETPGAAAAQPDLDRLAPDLAALQGADLPEGSLAARMLRVTERARAALADHELGADDLFRVNGELRVEVCRLLAEIQWAGADDNPAFEALRRAYDCG